MDLKSPACLYAPRECFSGSCGHMLSPHQLPSRQPRRGRAGVKGVKRGAFHAVEPAAVASLNVYDVGAPCKYADEIK